MTDIEIKLKALKWVRDSSFFLVFLQTVICGGLYYPLNQWKAFYGMMGEKINPLGVLLHAAWFFFIVSIIISAFIIVKLPDIVESFSNNSAVDDLPELRKVNVIGGASLQLMRLMQNAFFVTGLILMLWVVFFLPVV